MRERRDSHSFLSFLPRRERPLLAGNVLCFYHCIYSTSFLSNEVANLTIDTSESAIYKVITK